MKDTPPTKRWIAFCVAAVAVVGAIIVLRPSHDDGAVEGAEDGRLIPEASSAKPKLSQIAWIDLPYSFEAGIDRASAVAGGIRVKDTEEGRNATDGEQSYYIVFSPNNLAGLRSRAGAIRTALDSGMRLVIDVNNTTAPFPAVLVLSDSEGKRPVRLRGVGVPLGRSTLEFPLSYVERGPRTLPLSTVATLGLGCDVRDLDRQLHVYFDNLRLESSDTTLEPLRKKTSEPKSESERDARDLLSDGDFESGLLTWRLRQFPNSRVTAAIVEDDRSYREGRSLGIFELVEGGCALVSRDLNLAPGTYVVELAVRGTEKIGYRVLTEQSRGNRWVRVMAKDRAREVAPDQWATAEWELAIESSGEQSTEHGVQRSRAAARIVVEAIGAGDLFVDALRLFSVDSDDNDDRHFGRDESSPRAGSGQSSRLTWDGRGFLSGRKSTRPILFCRDAASRSRISKEFHEKCREKGLLSVLDVGGLFHSGLLSELEQLVRQRLDDPTIGLWLLSGDASSDVTPTVPSSVRAATQLLSEIDDRLVAVGVGASIDPLAAFTYADSSDVVVVGGPTSPIPTVESFKRFAAVLQGARRAVTGGPLLAQIDARAPVETVETFAYLAWLYGADGLLLNGFADQADLGQENSIEWVEFDAGIERLRTMSGLLATVTFDSGRVRVAGPVRYRVGRGDDDRPVLVAVNLSNRALNDVEVEVVPSVIRRRSFEKWEGVVVVLDEE